MWCVHFLGMHTPASIATKHQRFLSLTYLVCKITSPKKRVKIQHLLHLRAFVCKNQTYRGKGGKFDFFLILMLERLDYK